MIFEFYLGARFFRKRIINFLAIFVVAFSVLMPIVVLAVMEGFADYMEQQIRGALSDVIVGDVSIDAAVKDPRPISDRISSLPEVAGSSPFIRSFVIVKNRRVDGMISEPALLQGFDAEYEYRMLKSRGPRADLATQIFSAESDPALAALIKLLRTYPIPLIDIDIISSKVSRGDMTNEQGLEKFVELVEYAGGADAVRACNKIILAYKIGWGKIDECLDEIVFAFADNLEFTPETVFGNDKDEGFDEVVYPEAYLNVNLARKLGVNPDGTFVIASVNREGMPIKRKYRMKAALRPYSAAKVDRYDMPSVVVSYKEAELLFDTGGNATGISVWLKKGVDLKTGRNKIKEAAYYWVRTWKDLRYNILRAVENENRLLRIVLLCIAFAGGFAILAIIYTSVSEKVKDIGILKAVGITPRNIVAVFMNQTLIIGLIGTSLGVLFAYLVVDNIVWLSEVIGWTPFSADIYYLPPDESLPVSWEKAGVWFFSVSNFIICMLAGLYPALRAASLNAAESIRND